MSEGTAREIVARALFSRAALVDPDSDATREQFGADGVSHLMESYGRDADAVIAALAQAGALAPANPCPYCGRCLTAEPDAHARCMAQAEHDWIGDGVIVGVLAPAGLSEEQTMGKTELFHTDGVDDRGRSMADVLTVRMTRAQWWLARNQLRNMEDDWRRTKDEAMAARCADVADVIDDVLHDAADAAPGEPS